MTFDSYTVENDPHLISMREELTELEARKDELFKAKESEPTNAKVRLCYDAAVILWARASNNYESALRAVLLP
jgi:hypothetical protein